MEDAATVVIRTVSYIVIFSKVSFRNCIVKVLIQILEFQETVIKFMTWIKDSVKTLNSNVEHLHYMTARASMKSSEGGNGVALEVTDEKPSQFIPCSSHSELQELNKKLDNDKFFQHSVSSSLMLIQN